MEPQELNRKFGEYVLSSHPLLNLGTFEDELVRGAALSLVKENRGENLLLWDAYQGLRAAMWEEVVDGEPTLRSSTSEDYMAALKSLVASSELLLTLAEPVEPPFPDLPTPRPGASPQERQEYELKKRRQELQKTIHTTFNISALPALIEFMIHLSEGDFGFKTRSGQGRPGFPRLTILALGGQRDLGQDTTSRTIAMIKRLSVVNKVGQRTLALCGPNTEVLGDVSRLFVSMDIPLPSAERLRSLSINFFDHNRIPYTPDEVDEIGESGRGMTAAQFDNALALMVLRNVEQVPVEAGQEPVRIFHIKSSDIRDERDRVINEHKSLQVLKERVRPEDYSGHDKFVQSMRQGALAYTEAGRKFGAKPLRGVLLCGPAGTGKTYSGALLAYLTGASYIRHDLSGDKGSFVGETGQNFRQAIRVIEACGLTVVLNDEVEKVFGGAEDSNFSNGSGDILDEYLYKLQYGLRNAIIVMTTNRPYLLPPELIRRMSTVFYLGFPNEEARRKIFEIQFRGYGERSKKFDMSELLSHTKRWTGDEIRKLVERARLIALADNVERPVMKDEHLFEAMSFINPVYKNQTESVLKTWEWARRCAVSADPEDVKAEESEFKVVAAELESASARTV